jgi:hypothetical protein
MLWFAGLQGTLFGVLPVLPDGDGRKLFRWSRAASIVVLIAAFFAFIHFLLQPGYDDTVGPFQQNSTLAVLVMFAVFAAVTGLFWWRYPHRLRGEAGG